MEHIEKGLTLVRIIEHAMPPIKVKADIQAGDISYHHEEEAHQALIPIFEELDQVDIVGPAARVKREKSQASGQKRTEPLAVTYAGVEFTSLDLDLALAKRNLGRAQKALKDNRFDDADSALATIQARGVIFGLVEDYLPLRESADNLKLAEDDMKRGQPPRSQSCVANCLGCIKGLRKDRRRKSIQGSEKTA